MKPTKLTETAARMHSRIALQDFADGLITRAQLSHRLRLILTGLCATPAS